jgi:DNA processing protein
LPTINQNLHAALALSYLPLPPSLQLFLVKHYSGAASALNGAPHKWIDDALVAQETFTMLDREWDSARRFADTELQEIERNNVCAYIWGEETYPGLLAEIAVPPLIIYTLGQPLRDDLVPLAIVGSRRPTYYGEKSARLLTGELVEMGFTTVSGMARGVDSIVHGETIRLGGRTWAVLGSGLLNLYPRENRKLASQITTQGTLISEFPLHTPPHRGNFPRRNRIIAGISHGTLVVEGDEKSGSLITARLAAEEGRDVFAVPGPIFSPLSRGPHRLIQNGAVIVTQSEDILNALPEHIQSQTRCRPMRKEEYSLAASNMALLNELQSTALPREVLCERLHLPNSQLAAVILELELRGFVRSLPGGLVEKT